MGNNKQKGGDERANPNPILNEVNNGYNSSNDSDDEIDAEELNTFENALNFLIFDAPESPFKNNNDLDFFCRTTLNLFLNQYEYIMINDVMNDVTSRLENKFENHFNEHFNKYGSNTYDFQLKKVNILLAISNKRIELLSPNTRGGKGVSKCKKITSKKKYTTRKSPPYSASKCARGTRKKGNDGKLYVVKSTSKGVNRWMPVVSKKVKQTKKSKKSKK